LGMGQRHPVPRRVRRCLPAPPLAVGESATSCPIRLAPGLIDSHAGNGSDPCVKRLWNPHRADHNQGWAVGGSWLKQPHHGLCVLASPIRDVWSGRREESRRLVQPAGLASRPSSNRA
jgi:hypothetical protein